MQDMFLLKFKKLKQKNKVLFNKAMKKSTSAKGENQNESDGDAAFEREEEDNSAAASN